MEKLLLKIFSPLFIKRLKKFKSLKRGYYSFIIIVCVYLFTFFLEFFINSNALLIKYNGKYYFTVYSDIKLKKVIYKEATEAYKKYKDIRKEYKKATGDKKKELKEKMLIAKKEYKDFKELKRAFSKHRKLKEYFIKENKGNLAILPLYPYGPNEILFDELEDRNPPTPPDKNHWLGTDTMGRDVFARLAYGFRISMTFSLILVFFSNIIGITIGAILGYYTGKIDFFGLRLIEIWSSVPFLYTVMIISSIVEPNFLLLIVILTLWGWIGMTYYIRGEFLREKNKDYVQAAIAIGVSDIAIIFRHILPNSLTPVIAFLPFSIVGGISALVSLDFLGFGLAPPTPSWGELLGQGVANIRTAPWLGFAPVGAMFITLLLVTFIGEAIREAFDPKVYSRLR